MPPRRPRPSEDQQPLDLFPETLQGEKGHYLVGSMLDCTDEEFMRRRYEQLEISDALSLNKLNQQEFVRAGFLQGNYEVWQRQAEHMDGEDTAVALVGLAWAVHDAIEAKLPFDNSTKLGRDGVIDVARKIDKDIDARYFADYMGNRRVVDQQHKVITSFGYDCRLNSTQAFMEGVLHFTPARLVGNFLRAYKNAKKPPVILGPHDEITQRHIWRRTPIGAKV